MKKVLAVGLTFCLLLSGVGCNSGNGGQNNSSNDVKTGWYSLVEGVSLREGSDGYWQAEWIAGSQGGVCAELPSTDNFSYLNFKVDSEVQISMALEVSYSLSDGKTVSGKESLSVGPDEKYLTVYLDYEDRPSSIVIYPEQSNTDVKVFLSDCLFSDYYKGDELIICEYNGSLTPGGGDENPEEPGGGDENPEEPGGGDENPEEPGGGDENPEEPGGGDENPEEPGYEIVDDSPIAMEDRLYNRYSDYFDMGMVAGYQRYKDYFELEGHFNSFTCENEMKLYTIASNENTEFDYNDISTYDFSMADEMLTYMRRKGKKIRGHALMWYQEAPDWIINCKDKALLLEMIDTYCYNVVKHFSEEFGDVIYAWDVVNEAVSDNYAGESITQTAKEVFGSNDDGCNSMRSQFWDVAGIDYIITAFKAARRADPDVALFYNDYNICTQIQKLRGVVNLISKLIESNTPIDGVGLQSHFKLMNTSVVEEAEAAIGYLVKLAKITDHPLDIQITELDVENYGNSDKDLADFYGSLFEMYRRNAEYISSVTFWGVADDYSWLDNNQWRKAYPFLFDANLNKKPAFDSVFNF